MSRESLNENIPATSQTRPSSSTSIVSSSSFGGCGPSSLTSSTCYYNNSLAIRQEIQRFESVHPSIYAIYDLLELIGGADGQLIAQRVRDHVVCIEGKEIFIFCWSKKKTKTITDSLLSKVFGIVFFCC